MCPSCRAWVSTESLANKTSAERSEEGRGIHVAGSAQRVRTWLCTLPVGRVLEHQRCREESKKQLPRPQTAPKILKNARKYPWVDNKAGRDTKDTKVKVGGVEAHSQPRQNKRGVTERGKKKGCRQHDASIFFYHSKTLFRTTLKLNSPEKSEGAGGTQHHPAGL